MVEILSGAGVSIGVNLVTAALHIFMPFTLLTDLVVVEDAVLDVMR